MHKLAAHTPVSFLEQVYGLMCCNIRAAYFGKYGLKNEPTPCRSGSLFISVLKRICAAASQVAQEPAFLKN